MLPLHFPQNGGCSCGSQNCTSPGKHPLLNNGLKGASKDSDQITAWWKQWPNANIGILCGQDSNLLVLDIDGAEGARALDFLLGLEPEPDTLIAITGNGKHIYFQHPGGMIKNSVAVGGYKGLDIRGDNSYVVAPVSVHVNGKQYVFEDEDSEITPVPAWLLDIIEKKFEISVKTKPVIEAIPKGTRNDRLTAIAGGMRRQGMDESEISESILIANRKCDPPLPETEIQVLVESVCRYQPIPELLKFHKTDLGNSARMAYLYGKEIKYCTLWCKWLLWNGQRWKLDDTNKIYKKARETIQSMYRVGADIENDKERADFITHAAKTESVFKISAMVELLKSEDEIAVIPNDLDTHSFLLNVQNGTFDLKDLTLKDPDPANLLTKMAGTVFDGNSECPLWNQFLLQIMDKNEKMIKFLQQIVGYNLCGDTSEHVFFVIYGPGANGKSVFLQTIASLMGDYATATPVNTFLITWNDNIPNDIARLKGARFIYAVESEGKRKLASARVKQFCGEDTVTARFLRAEFFEFKVTGKVFLCSNHKPIIEDASWALWRRIKLVPFNIIIPDKDQDKKLQEKLRKELPGILNWAIQGYAEWQEKGLIYPSEILDATLEYRTESDSLADFLNTRCEMDSYAAIKAGELYEIYSQWCEASGEKKASKTALGKELRERGFRNDRTSGTSRWFGIKERK